VKKSYYKNPNRRSNWFKGEEVPEGQLAKRRLKRYKELAKQGYSDAHCLVKALEIIPK